MNYLEADSKLQGRNKLSRKVGNNTYLVRNSGVPGDSIHLKLHSTYIVTWYADGRIELNSGGWRTVTTKARINEYVEGWGISQEHGQWFIHRPVVLDKCLYCEEPQGKHNNFTLACPEKDGTDRDWDERYKFTAWHTNERTAMFADGAVIHPDGTLSGAEPISEYDKALKLRRRVQRFAAKYIEAFGKGKVPAPSNGDCLYCNVGFRSQENKPLGETVHDKDHILSHLEENYFVPSLLMRAFETMPHSQVMGWAIGEKWGKEREQAAEIFSKIDGGSQFFDMVRTDLQKMLSKYILRQLGQAA